MAGLSEDRLIKEILDEVNGFIEKEINEQIKLFEEYLNAKVAAFKDAQEKAASTYYVPVKTQFGEKLLEVIAKGMADQVAATIGEAVDAFYNGSQVTTSTSAQVSVEGQVDKVIPSRGSRKKKKPAMIKCEFCGKKFRFRSFLIAHQHVHLKERAYKCKEPNCPKTYKYKYQLTRHNLTAHHNIPGLSIFECGGCARKFKSKQALINHLSGSHKDIKLMWKCNVCKGRKTYLSRAEFESHVGEVHDSDAFEAFSK